MSYLGTRIVETDSDKGEIWLPISKVLNDLFLKDAASFLKMFYQQLVKRWESGGYRFGKFEFDEAAPAIKFKHFDYRLLGVLKIDEMMKITASYITGSCRREVWTFTNDGLDFSIKKSINDSNGTDETERVLELMGKWSDTYIKSLLVYLEDYQTINGNRI